MKKIIIFLGGFGSGKTECAVNMAITKAEEGFKTALVDLDIVNPMFRSTFFVKALEKAGVDLVASESMKVYEGLPTVSEDVRNVFFDDHECVVFDVGGDKIGAVALGQYHRFFSESKAEIQTLFVINIRRPSSNSEEDIYELYKNIERVSRITVDGFINNSNLSMETTTEIVMEGDALLRQVSKKMDKPILFVSGRKEILQELEEKYSGRYAGRPLIIITRPRLPWE